MRYYISDMHFYHNALNESMDKRGFLNAEEMNEYMIRKWNGKVRENDEVVVLGDFSFERGAKTTELLKRLNGRLYLIRGNHDYYIDDRNFDSSRFVWIKDYDVLKDDGRRVVLSHYPIFCYKGQFDVDKHGNPKTYMLYGHVHNTYDEVLVNRFIYETRASKRTLINGSEVNIPCQMINCFCMFSDYEPLSLDEWIEVDKKRREELLKNN